jgi:hypothetical protein
MHTENEQVISSANKCAHREPHPIHTPKTPTDKNREDPPDSPGGMGGGGGHTQGQSTLILIGNSFREQTAQDR